MRGIGGEGGYHLQSSVRRASVYIPGPTLHKFDATFIFKMSALPPKADMDQQGRDVRFVPKADIASPSWWLQTGRRQSNCAFVGSGGLVHSRPRKLMASVEAAQALRSRMR